MLPGNLTTLSHQNITDVAHLQAVLHRFCLGEQQLERGSITLRNRHDFHYKIHSNVVYVVAADRSYPRKLAFL